MSSPRLLALDGATETLHLAVVVGEAVTRADCPGGALASAQLLPAVASLLTRAGVRLAELDAVAFGRGPGAFTGLRTACAVAQGLAVGIDRPVLALDTLALVAESAHRQSGGTSVTVWALLDARMGEVYAARWRRQVDGSWAGDDGVEATTGRLWSPTALAEAIAAAPADLAGPGLVVHGHALAAVGGARWPDARPDGESLAALARVAHAGGQGLDPADALPLYVRDKVAQTTAERLAAKLATAA